ncbi:MAG TPA: response regulator transcription factor [Sphingobium sp.]|nr:response regulator transcription factor [Sphingobium sp.]
MPEIDTVAGAGADPGDAPPTILAGGVDPSKQQHQVFVATAGTMRDRYVQQPGGVRLLIIDSRSLTRDCLVAAISHAKGIATINAVADVAVAVAKICDDAAPDAILINFSNDPLSDDRLASFLGPLRLVAPHSGLLMLSASLSKGDVLTALRHGIAGLLDSDAPFDLVIQAICLVATGLMIYPAYSFGPEFFASAGGEASIASKFDFTERQRQVLEQLQQGHTNGTIAVKLAVSERTVKAHVKAIMRRLGATNRTQVVALMSRKAPVQGWSGTAGSSH